MAFLGYRPAGNARGCGEMFANTSRITEMGTLGPAGWLIEAGVRAGRNTGATTTLNFIMYSGASGPGPLVWASPGQAVAAYMAGNDPSTGVNVVWSGITGVAIPANTKLFAGLRPAGASAAYGQSNSGATMWFDSSAATIENPFAATSASAQGQIDAWIVTQDNRPPTATIIAPSSGGVTSDTTPQITVGFSDPDQPLGDSLSAALIEVWSSDNRVILHSSGWFAASGASASWSVPGALTPGLYYVRAYVKDALGLQSGVKQWTFTINAGGTVQLDSGLAPTDGIKTFGGDNTFYVYNTVRPPYVRATWTHQSGANLVTWEWQLRRLQVFPSNPLVRGPATSSPGGGLASGSSADLAYQAGWADLPRGDAVYYWEVRGLDALGSWSPWAFSEFFLINAYPVATNITPASGKVVSTPPTVETTIEDSTDNVGVHTVVVQVDEVNTFASPVSTTLPHVGADVYRGTLSGASFPALGTYYWRVNVTDDYGLTATGATRTLQMVAPPAITGLSPSNGATVTVGTPTISATLDRTISSYRIRIGRHPGIWYADSTVLAGSGTTLSWTVPAATLPNGLTYDLYLDVTTADGLTAQSVTQFTVQYVAPDPLSNVTGVAVASSVFDTGLFTQLPNVDLAWDAVTTASVPDEDWIGYVIYRPGHGRDEMWLIADRNQVTFTDVSAVGNKENTYYIGYRRWVNDKLDQLDSVLTLVRVTPTLRHTTLTSQEDPGIGVTFHFWESRSRRKKAAIEAVEILGQATPDVWQGPTNYDEVEIDARLLDDEGGAYTARDIVAALDAVSAPVRNVAGKLVPRTLFWRDPRGRSYPIAITSPPEETDPHMVNQAQVRFVAVQVHQSSVDLTGIDTASAVEIS